MAIFKSKIKLRVVIYSPSFLPVLGGLENMMHFLATGLSNLKAEVTVITLVKEKVEGEEQFSYKIERNPSYLEFYRIYKNCDAYLNFNVSIKGLWPLFLKPKPFFVSHQITYINLDGSIDYLERIKRFISRFSCNIYCTEFVKNSLGAKKGHVIGNCYDEMLFKNLNLNRDLEIAFVGRLVSDKGIDTLIKALILLKEKDGLIPNLTIIGEGPEQSALRLLIKNSNMNTQINLVGSYTGEKLVGLLNRHQLLVVPSKWKEPFGIVALEGLACGCDLIVSKNGGLIEACGGLSLNFENGDELSLYETLKFYFSNKTSLFNQNQIDAHLAQHKISSISEKYLAFIKDKIK